MIASGLCADKLLKPTCCLERARDGDVLFVWSRAMVSIVESAGFGDCVAHLGTGIPTHPADGLPVLGASFRLLTLVCCCSV